MWIQKIRNRKLQMFLIGLIVAVSSFMLSSAIGIFQNTKSPMDDLIKKTDAPIVCLTLNQSIETKQEYENIKKFFEKNSKVEKIKTIENVAYNIGDFKAKGKDVETNNNFLKYEDGDFGHISFLKGVEKLEVGECYISSSLSETYKLSIGDYISTNGSKGKKEFYIKDIYTEPFTAPFSISIQRIYVNESDLESIDSIKMWMMNVFAKEGISVKEILDDYRDNYDNKFPVGTLDLDLCKLAAETSSKVIGGFIGVFALIILLVSTIVIRASVYDSLVKEYKTIGVYKSFGLSHFRIMGIYIRAYLLVVSIALIMGVASSKVFIKFVLVRSFKGYDYNGDISMMLPLVITAIFVMSIILGCIFAVIYKTKKIYPVEALTKYMPSNERVISYIPKLENNFSPWALAVRRCSNYKKLTSLLLVVLFICSYSMLFAVTNYNTVSKTSGMGSFWAGIDDGELKVQIKNKDKLLDIENFIKNNPNISSYIRCSPIYSGVEVSKKDRIYKDKNLLACVSNDFNNGFKFQTIEGRNPRNEDEVCVNKLILEKGKKSIGDYISLCINGEEKNFLIVGSHQSVMGVGFNIRLLESVVKKYSKTYMVDNISIKVKDKSKVQALKDEINQKFEGWIDIKEDKDVFKETMNSVMEPQRTALLPFIVIVVIIGAINVFSVITLININNKRSFSIYKTLGFSNRHLIVSNQIYILVLSVISSALSIPVFTLTFTKIMSAGMKFMGIHNYPADYNWCVIIATIMGSIFIYSLSSVISSLSIRKVNVTEINEE